MNVDYSICNALKYRSKGLSEALIIYDVGCQWWINFLLRLRQSKTLSIPDMKKLIVAVGSFHLGAHIPECFVLFSLHFVQGSGQLDGEILETLWAAFNKISPSARAMSTSHRREVYDDHMRDSNWKKLVGMGACN
jgi:Kyakuja-Dileera-Zisupton transposase